MPRVPWLSIGARCLFTFACVLTVLLLALLAAVIVRSPEGGGASLPRPYRRGPSSPALGRGSPANGGGLAHLRELRIGGKSLAEHVDLLMAAVSGGGADGGPAAAADSDEDDDGVPDVPAPTEPEPEPEGDYMGLECDATSECVDVGPAGLRCTPFLSPDQHPAPEACRPGPGP